MPGNILYPYISHTHINLIFTAFSHFYPFKDEKLRQEVGVQKGKYFDSSQRAKAAFKLIYAIKILTLYNSRDH